MREHTPETRAGRGAEIGHRLGPNWASRLTVVSVTVRDKVDQLISSPAVGDLGYPADQRVVASVVLGLKLLADSIDAMEYRLHAAEETDEPPGVAADVTSEVRELSAHLEELTTHVSKLANTIKTLTQNE